MLAIYLFGQLSRQLESVCDGPSHNRVCNSAMSLIDKLLILRCVEFYVILSLCQWFYLLRNPILRPWNSLQLTFIVV